MTQTPRINCDFSNVMRWIINTQESIEFLYIDDKQEQVEIWKTQYLGIHLRKYVWDLYAKIYKMNNKWKT